MENLQDSVIITQDPPDSDLIKLKKKRVIIGAIFTWYILTYMLLFDFILFFWQIFGYTFYAIYIAIIISSSVLFFRNENAIDIANFRSTWKQWTFAPWIKCGIYLLILVFITGYVALSFLLITMPIYWFPLLVMSICFFIYGAFFSKIPVSKDWNSIPHEIIETYQNISTFNNQDIDPTITMKTSQDQNTSIRPTQIITDPDIKKLKLKIIIFASLLASLFLFIFIYTCSLDFFSLDSFARIYSKLLLLLSYFAIIIFSILLLRNENNIEIAYFISNWIQRGLTPWIKYGILLSKLSGFMLISSVLWGLKLLFMVPIIIFIAMIFTIYGIFISKASVLRNGEIIPQKVFSEYNSRKGTSIIVFQIFSIIGLISLYSVIVAVLSFR